MGKMMPKMLIASKVGGNDRRPEPDRYREPERMPDRYRDPDRYREPTRREPEREMRGQGWVTWDRTEPPIYPDRGNITDMQEYRTRGHDDARREWRGENERDKIGFAREEGDGMREYGRRYDPDTHNSQRLTKQMAENWVKGMRGADGSRGGRWSLDEIKRFASNFGVNGEENVLEFYAVINAMYTDYNQVAKKFGVDKADFYAELAKAFMADADANPGKVLTYYEDIARK